MLRADRNEISWQFAVVSKNNVTIQYLLIRHCFQVYLLENTVNTADPQGRGKCRFRQEHEPAM